MRRKFNILVVELLEQGETSHYHAVRLAPPVFTGLFGQYDKYVLPLRYY